MNANCNFYFSLSLLLSSKSSFNKSIFLLGYFVLEGYNSSSLNQDQNYSEASIRLKSLKDHEFASELSEVGAYKDKFRNDGFISCYKCSLNFDVDKIKQLSTSLNLNFLDTCWSFHASLHPECEFLHSKERNIGYTQLTSAKMKWSTSKKSENVRVFNNTMVQMWGEKDQFGLIRSQNSIPMESDRFCFEVKIINPPSGQCILDIGLTSEHAICPTKMIESWSKKFFSGFQNIPGSFGYSSRGIIYGEKTTENVRKEQAYSGGDIVGCQVDKVNGVCCFTKNGVLLNKIIYLSRTEELLYPTIAFASNGTIVQSYFGKKKLEFDMLDYSTIFARQKSLEGNRFASELAQTGAFRNPLANNKISCYACDLGFDERKIEAAMNQENLQSFSHAAWLFHLSCRPWCEFLQGLEFKDSIRRILGFKSSGDTLLHSAIMDGDVKKVEALIKFGAKTSYTTTVGEGEIIFTKATPINIAIYMKYPGILAALLKASDVIESMDINCQDTKGTWSPLELAARIAKDTKNKNTILNFKLLSTFMICQYVTTRNIKQENIPGWCRIGMTRIKDMLIGCIDKKYLGYDFSHIINELSEAELVTAVTTKQFGACTGNFLKLMVRHVVMYEDENEHEMSKFTLDLALDVQEKLKMGDFMYDEMKNLTNDGNSKFSIASVPSKTMQDYLCLAAFRTHDKNVLSSVIVDYVLSNDSPDTTDGHSGYNRRISLPDKYIGISADNRNTMLWLVDQLTEIIRLSSEDKLLRLLQDVHLLLADRRNDLLNFSGAVISALYNIKKPEHDSKHDIVYKEAERCRPYIMQESFQLSLEFTRNKIVTSNLAKRVLQLNLPSLPYIIGCVRTMFWNRGVIYKRPVINIWKDVKELLMLKTTKNVTNDKVDNYVSNELSFDVNIPDLSTGTSTYENSILYNYLSSHRQKEQIEMLVDKMVRLMELQTNAPKIDQTIIEEFYNMLLQIAIDIDQNSLFSIVSDVILTRSDSSTLFNALTMKSVRDHQTPKPNECTPFQVLVEKDKVLEITHIFGILEWEVVNDLLDYKFKTITCVDYMALKWDNLDKKLDSIEGFIPKSVDNLEKVVRITGKILRAIMELNKENKYIKLVHVFKSLNSKLMVTMHQQRKTPFPSRLFPMNI